MNNFVLDKITNSIISELEKGIIPWDKPFLNGKPKNYISGKEYQGFNAFILGTSGFKSSYWLTYNQARQQGGSIKAGSKGTIILFWSILENLIETILKDGSKKQEVKKTPFLRYSTIFNFDQTSGLKSKETNTEELKPIAKAEKIKADYLLQEKDLIIQSGNQPCYIPNRDIIEISDMNNFKSAEGYYSTLFHEMAHSTGHEKRLNRQDNNKQRNFGDVDYSKEELIAEFTSSFLCGDCKILKAVKRNNTAYIQSWLKALNNDKSQLITASSQAQKAYNYILNKNQ